METKIKAVSAVTFHVFRKDGSKNPDIRNFFLENMILDAHTVLEQRIVLPDRTEWELVLEESVKEAFRASMTVKCIISFQARVNGNFAVARLYRENYKQNKTQTKRG